MRFLRLILLMLVVLPLTACAQSDGSLEGQVLEAGTNKPIEGAIVVVRWQGTWMPPAGTSTCYHVESAVTDAQGRYKTAAWSGPFRFGLLADYWEVDAYKPGYAAIPTSHVVQGGKSGVSYLELFKGTREERFKANRIAGIKCPNAGSSQRNLIPLYKAIYEQLATLALTKDEKFYANSYLNAIEEIELPEEEATRRDLERRERIRNENK